ncbi:MAG TPA: VOC family protein [Candidatus Saccharimonadales bacterium]|nr:VOC family protein [Candidatus Saccharimonadales bacterium]
MQKITPCLWFDTNAEEAMNFYVSIFNNSRVVSIKRYPERATDEHLKGMSGKVLTGIFELEGQRFMCLDGGPTFKFNEAISLVVDCETQAELDDIWNKLSAVPEAEQCGWLKDKFGLSWQIVPRALPELLNNPDQEKAGRALEALMKMKKLDIDALRNA